ncbi:hypothetical protein BDK89_2616 [Ilumatobacter fluminis]|uniref:Zinc ribbon domain-containing protein n=1 Tax=Ilumatobacter fluminis TaxID=467091 RepID=A0A4R7I0S8_9ACTN|nr:zinc ribbon domain-containing protein [Ilumatobacter fluminis]TDT17015.1 hypothetical protein BDK89_2616 [Ilumatobacter fluminis]
MIVCKECGTQNDDDDLFCGGCPAFLEHSGERIDDGSEPEPVTEFAAPERDGLVTRIKHAITGDHLPPPTGSPSDPTGPAGSPGSGTAIDADAELTDEQRRARALLATETAQEPAETATPRSAPSTTTDGPAGARTPEAVVPQEARARPRKVKQPPSRTILPGDLICGACGEGNPDTRKFCRRCGDSLIEAEVKKASWWRRLVPTRKKKEPLKASERPDRGTHGTVGSKARVARGKFLGKLAQGRRLLALLAIVGIGVGFAIPSVRNMATDTASDGYDSVRRVVSPTYSNIPIDPDRVEASSAFPPTDAADVTDSNTLTYWEPDPADRDASVTVTFVEATDVEHVLVHPGKQEDGGQVIRPDPRPRELLFRVLDDDGSVNEVVATIEDEDGFQTVELGVDAAVSVETVVINCYPDPVVTVCPITELEFQTKD